MKTKIFFKMMKNSEVEYVWFDSDPKISEVEEYFEESCGGVYRWWV